MPYDEDLAERVRSALGKRAGLVERRMFGGLCFMLRGNMAVGVTGDELMVRVGPAAYEEALARPHTREMDFTGKPLKGFVFVEAAGIRKPPGLDEWIERGLAFARSLPPK